MKIILLQNVNKLGKTGDIKDVSPGYFRNFLIPRKLAILATEEAVFELQKRKKSTVEKSAKEQKKFQKIAKKLEGLEILIKAKADEKGKLYGSVNEEQISKKIKENGFEIDSRYIIISEPIKKIGNYTVVVKMGQGREIKVYLKVLGE